MPVVHLQGEAGTRPRTQRAASESRLREPQDQGLREDQGTASTWDAGGSERHSQSVLSQNGIRHPRVAGLSKRGLDGRE